MSSSSRIIHISDTHCTTRNYTSDVNLAGIVGDGALDKGAPQDNIAKCNEIVDFLDSNREMLRTNRIVHSGDLVDSAGRDDFNAEAKQYLLNPLSSAGFDITIVPGNHDFFVDGNQFLTSKVINRIADAGVDSIAQGAEQFFNAFGPYMKTSGPNVYPVDLDLGNGNHLILIDSLKGHYDVQTGSHKAQGNIGEQQLNWLRKTLPNYQKNRADGSKIAMVMHHNPWDQGSSTELADAEEFLDVITNQIDALMFGHTGNPHQFYYDYAWACGIPVITSENIEHMSDNGYPISVIDLTFNTVEVYNTKLGKIAVEMLLPDKRVPVPLMWFATF